MFKGLGLGVRGLRFRDLKGSLTCQCQQGRFQLGPISTYPAFYGSVGCIRSLRGFKRGAWHAMPRPYPNGISEGLCLNLSGLRWSLLWFCCAGIQ